MRISVFQSLLSEETKSSRNLLRAIVREVKDGDRMIHGQRDTVANEEDEIGQRIPEGMSGANYYLLHLVRCGALIEFEYGVVGYPIPRFREVLLDEWQFPGAP